MRRSMGGLVLVLVGVRSFPQDEDKHKAPASTSPRPLVPITCPPDRVHASHAVPPYLKCIDHKGPHPAPHHPRPYERREAACIHAKGLVPGGAWIATWGDCAILAT